MEISIRKAVFEDIEAIETLFIETIKITCTDHYNEQQLNVWAASVSKNRWQELINQHIFFVATNHKNIVGFVAFDADKNYLDLLYIHKNYLRQKIATKLVDVVINISKALKINTIETHASITAKPFFEELGFQVVAENVSYIGEVGFLNYLMRKLCKN